MTQSFDDTLKDSADQNGIISAGYDPAPVEFPQEEVSGYDDQLPNPASNYEGSEVRRTIVNYFEEFAEEMEKQGVQPGGFKPNLGYFRMFDDEERWGQEALNEVIDRMNDFNVPVILDAKDADIGRSSAAYAISKLENEEVDAMTVHPWMGTDSVTPFFEIADQNGQGVYVLTRTTNPGAEDFQDLKAEGQPMYMHVADKIVDWSENYPGAVGSVVAGNNVNELREVSERFAESDADIPLLIPGVGTQGGQADEVIETLEESGVDPRMARINSSSGIMYRAQKDGRSREEHAEASVEELMGLNQETDLEQVLEG